MPKHHRFFLLILCASCLPLYGQFVSPTVLSACGSDLPQPFFAYSPSEVQQREIEQIKAYEQTNTLHQYLWKFDLDGRTIVWAELMGTDTLFKVSRSLEEEGGRVLWERWKSDKNKSSFQVGYRYHADGRLFQEKKYLSPSFDLLSTAYYHFYQNGSQPQLLRTQQLRQSGEMTVCDCFYDKTLNQLSKQIAWKDAAAQTSSDYTYLDGKLLSISQNPDNQAPKRYEYEYDKTGKLKAIRLNKTLLYSFFYTENGLLKEMKENGKTFVFTYTFLP